MKNLLLITQVDMIALIKENKTQKITDKEAAIIPCCSVLCSKLLVCTVNARGGCGSTGWELRISPLGLESWRLILQWDRGDQKSRMCFWLCLGLSSDRSIGSTCLREKKKESNVKDLYLADAFILSDMELECWIQESNLSWWPDSDVTTAPSHLQKDYRKE